MHIRRTVTGCGGLLFVARGAPCGFEKSFKVSFFISKNDVLYDFRAKIAKGVVFHFKKRRFLRLFPGRRKSPNRSLKGASGDQFGENQPIFAKMVTGEDFR